MASRVIPPPVFTRGWQPQPLWACFEQLTRIPRASQHEAAVMRWLKRFADAKRLDWSEDAAGNVLIRRPGSGGGEAAPSVVIQTHTDMVCEKTPDSAHDFMRDPLRLRKVGGWVLATDTTLGADNGIGVAAALALLDMPASAKLPPLECLFTVDEETGLTGAFGLDGSMISGRTILNLDTEEFGKIYIGCAGGGGSLIRMPRDTEEVPAAIARDDQINDGSNIHHINMMVAMDFALSGLMGGHSGVNIHEYRGNGVVLGCRVLKTLVEQGGARLQSVRGGEQHNAIPRECFATILVDPARMSQCEEIVANALAAIQKEYLIFRRRHRQCS